MTLLSSFLAAVAIGMLAAPAIAEGVEVLDPYARAMSAAAKSGAAFMELRNSADSPDRLVAARSDVAERVELHTHISDGDGVMRMVEVKDGFAIPAGGSHMLKRGGDHVMFLGLREVLDQGDTVSVTLVFENAGEVTVEVPVDLERMPAGHGG